jgi:alkylation response protein AidB-like acyl-CoA dehydrogenase
VDFDDTPEEAAYRAKVRAFLAAHAEPKGATELAFRGRYSVVPDILVHARAWQAIKAQYGFAGITFAKEWGGQGLMPMMEVIYAEEEGNFAVPQGVFEIGLAMCIPTLIRYAPDAARQLAGPALRGEAIWCQLFSEPAAGSDLAAITTRAVLEGDHWIINGQKTWTSVAHMADYGLLLARTDSSVPKHAGITAFFVDMRTAGVEVRPIKQISGHSHFNEVFFSDVHIPDTARIAKVGEGWRVANSTLSSERYATGVASGPHFEDIYRLVSEMQTPDGTSLSNPTVREKLADWYVRARGLKYTRFRILTALSRGEVPGPEASIGKLVSSAQLQQITAFGVDLLGMAGGIADCDLAPMKGWFQEAFLYAPASRIAGGTDEILRNIIAERVLGLPPDLRVDRGVPFKDLPAQ